MPDMVFTAAPPRRLGVSKLPPVQGPEKLKRRSPGRAQVVDGTLECSLCLMVKRVSEFSPSSANTTGYRSRCKICRNKSEAPAPELRFVKDAPVSRGRGTAERGGAADRRRRILAEVASGQLTCTKCEQTKPLDQFHKNANTVSGYNTRCIACRQTVRVADRQWPYTLKYNYGLTVAQYDAMFEAQKGLCACCGRPETRLSRDGVVTRLGVDHDHRCCPGKQSCGACVRSLLCAACNLTVGMLESTPGLWEPFADYLDTYGRGPLEHVDVLAMLGG